MTRIVLIAIISSMLLIPVGKSVYAGAEKTVSNSSTELEKIMKEL